MLYNVINLYFMIAGCHYYRTEKDKILYKYDRYGKC